MATHLFSKRLRPSPISSEVTAYVCHVCRRNAASYRRTRKALRVATDPSFAPSETETQDHIIFNPPPSAPNVYHTPVTFLPKSDPRRATFLAASAGTETLGSQPTLPQGVIASIAAERARLTPPAAELKPVRPIKEKKYHLEQDQIDEIRRLRKEDPRQWTRVRLANKFACSEFFISLCCSSPEMAEKQEQRLSAVRSKWGRRKTEAREARQERKKRWGMDA